METCIWKYSSGQEDRRDELKKGMKIVLERGTVLLLHSGSIIPLPNEPKAKRGDNWKIRQTLPDGYQLNLPDVLHAMQDFQKGLRGKSYSFYERVVTIFFFSDRTYYLMDRGTYIRYREKCMKEWLWEPKQIKKGHEVSLQGTYFSSMHNALVVDGDLQPALENLDQNKNIHWMHLIFFIPSDIKSQHVSGSKLTLQGSRKQNQKVVWGLSDGSKTALINFSEWLQIIQRKPETRFPHVCLAHHHHA